MSALHIQPVYVHLTSRTFQFQFPVQFSSTELSSRFIYWVYNVPLSNLASQSLKHKMYCFQYAFIELRIRSKPLFYTNLLAWRYGKKKFSITFNSIRNYLAIFSVLPSKTTNTSFQVQYESTANKTHVFVNVRSGSRIHSNKVRPPLVQWGAHNPCLGKLSLL